MSDKDDQDELLDTPSSQKDSPSSNAKLLRSQSEHHVQQRDRKCRSIIVISSLEGINTHTYSSHNCG